MKKIAVFFGGHSSEYAVSLESAYHVLRNLNSKRYQSYPVGISRDGSWYLFTGDIAKIKADQWLSAKDCVPAALSPNRLCKGLLLFRETKVETIPIDAAFPVMHGKYGEDGTIQGLITLSGIPLVGCGVLASALCMDKNRAHKLAQCAGVAVPRSHTFGACFQPEEALNYGKALNYPLFVKPVRAGSSYGVTKVQKEPALLPAVRRAFRYDNEILLEEAIEGVEVGCAVMGSETLTTGEVDEIELAGGFFDYAEKYTLKTSAIHVPARIGRPLAKGIKNTAMLLYRALGCSGFARVDFFLTPDQRIIFNEINTIPGFTEHSRFPGMMRAAGIPFPELLETVLEEAVEP